ncbi:4723_t:CDS:2, partial [Acaulospora colombiana]
PGTQICVPNMTYNGPVVYPEDLSTNPRCQAQQYSIRGDSCRTIGNMWGLYDYQIWNANTWATPTSPPSTITVTASTTPVTASQFSPTMDWNAHLYPDPSCTPDLEYGGPNAQRPTFREPYAHPHAHSPVLSSGVTSSST